MELFNLEDFIAKNVTKRKESLFSRDIEKNHDKLSGMIDGKRVLVIGGGGSIGSSFIRVLLRFKPKSLVVADINENALTELTRDLRSRGDLNIPEEYHTYPMNAYGNLFMEVLFERKRFDIVANFAAYKHVRSEKDHLSLEAMMRNNVFDVRELLRKLELHPPEVYFCVSTDKAANPVSFMGASKRLMEELIFLHSDKYRVTTARFANVAFSNGSLPAGFLERINKLQPVTAPNDIKRYFVSPDESGEICLLACMLGKNREIFFPKLRKEEMIGFDEIAIALLKAKGFEAEFCGSEKEAVEKCAEFRKKLLNGKVEGEMPRYPVYFSKSDTSGEKPYEEFFTEDEEIETERFEGLGIIINKPLPEYKYTAAQLNKLSDMLEFNSSKEEIARFISGMIPTFKHKETGKSLDSKL